MSFVKSKLGPATTQIGDMTYDFIKNNKGHFVCDVFKITHVSLLVSAGTYEHYDPEDGVSADDLAALQTNPPAAETDEDGEGDGDADDQGGSDDDKSGDTDTTNNGDGTNGPDLSKLADGSDLTRIGGVGSSTATKLNAVGITLLTDIAALNAELIETLNETLKLNGAIERGDWVNQAKQLVEEDTEARRAAQVAADKSE